MPVPFQIRASGDAAVVVDAPQRIDPAINAWCVALAERARDRFGDAVRDVVVGYCSTTVYFDPLMVDGDWVEDELQTIAAQLDAGVPADGRVVEVPVRYGGERGPDLGEVARFAGCSEDEVVSRHAGTLYRVYLLGFVPGFAYLAEVDARIAMPRRSSPRTVVPPGSVAIAGFQTGVYPAATPGGWNIVGRTTVAPHDPNRAEPFLFRVGDAVRFRADGG